MKVFSVLAILTLSASTATPVGTIKILSVGTPAPTKEPTPIERVVTLIEDLATQIQDDGKTEQASYDKYACWVEDTLQRKASDIASAKELLPQLDDAILKGKAEIASHGAEINQLNKDIAQNKEAQKEATAIRDKAYKEYSGERLESEQCIGALEAAVKVLTGAGAKKEGGFLQQFHEAELMSVTMGVRKVLADSRSVALISEANMEVVRNFVQHPSTFGSQGMIAAQTGQNPFGDYAPQSSQIQGILKGMYDAFTQDLEKENSEEANEEKSFQELMATKKQEEATLEATLQKQEADQASKTKKLSEDVALKDDTTEQLAADETFFEETKKAAENKATEWSTRTRLRTEELAGMEGAIQILNGGDKVFQEATTTFLQMKVVSKHTLERKAYGELKHLAAKYQTAGLAKLVQVMKSGGHFDKVIIMIDKMMEVLRAEEQEDIEHRDRCENGENANSNEMEDLSSAIAKTDKKLERLDREKENKNKELGLVKADMIETRVNLGKMLDLRNEEHTAFVRAMKMDTEAVDLIGMAIVRLSKYYKENKIPLGLMEAPEYSEDPDKAPETNFSGGESRQGESTGIVAILSMIKEDLQKEIKEGKADDAKAQEEYEAQSGALQDTLDKQRETRVTLEKTIASVEEEESRAEKYKQEKKDDKDAEHEMKKALKTDCAWVKETFAKRRSTRKTEMQGLVEAKNFLAGVEAGEPELPPR